MVNMDITAIQRAVAMSYYNWGFNYYMALYRRQKFLSGFSGNGKNAWFGGLLPKNVGALAMYNFYAAQSLQALRNTFRRAIQEGIMRNDWLSGPSRPNTEISQITDTLYLCAARAVTEGKVRALGITCVINVTLELPFMPLGSGIEYVKIPIVDAPTSNLAAHFDAVADKVREVRRQGGRTLIHCVAGVSRSAALCMVYLMKYEGLSLKQAYFHVRGRRSIVRPNVGFFRQMVEYEKRILGKTSVALVPNPIGAGLIPDLYEEEFKANMMWEQLQQRSQQLQQPPAIPARSYSAQQHYIPASSMTSPLTPQRLQFGSPSAMANAVPHHGAPLTLGGGFSPLAVSTPFPPSMSTPPPTAFMRQGPGRMASSS